MMEKIMREVEPVMGQRAWRDMGELIRCRDCKHSRDNGERCEHWANEWEDAWVDPNGFCAWAERDE